MKALIVGDITVDIIDDRFRIGGPGLYGGRALSEYLGVETYVLTHVEENFRGMILGTLNIYGIKVLEIQSKTMPVFVIRGGKAVEYRGSIDSIPEELVLASVDAVKPDIVVLAPVMNELGISVINSLVSYGLKTLAVDIQGYVRSIESGRIACKWLKELEQAIANADIVHGNIAEFCFSSSEEEVLRYLAVLTTQNKSAVLVSLDQRGTYVVHQGEAYYIPALAVNAVDSVGTGDILLAVSSYFKASGLPILEAVTRGVVAASLKVENAYRTWFDKETVETVAEEHVKNIRAVKV